MKVWEAIQMLEAMDQTKEVTITFGKPAKAVEQQRAQANNAAKAGRLLLLLLLLQR